MLLLGLGMKTVVADLNDFGKYPVASEALDIAVRDLIMHGDN